MTPKEKAQELVSKYELLLVCPTTYGSPKECALIAVNEIILNTGKTPFMYIGKNLMLHENPYQFKEYWQSVKDELTRL